jgi:CheY-like chemotaxis protein
MGGGDTYARIKEIDPRVKALFSSGYSIDGQAGEIMKRGCDGFIQKPFTAVDLYQKLIEIIAT